MSERWLSVVGYEGLYEVSDFGRVRSLDRIGPGRWGPVQYVGQLLIPIIGSGGYPRVNLSRNGVAIGFVIHLLVLRAFIGPCPDGMEARHLDGNSGNPRLENLVWGTKEENCADKVAHGTAHNLPKGEEHSSAKLTDAKVREMRKLRNFERISWAELSRRFGASPMACKFAVLRKTWKHVV